MGRKLLKEWNAESLMDWGLNFDFDYDSLVDSESDARNKYTKRLKLRCMSLKALYARK